jgi:hypothetical protein
MEKKLFVGIKLTPDQTKKLTAAQKKRDADAKKVMDANMGQREGMREKLKPVMEAYSKELDVILTKDQQKQYKKNREEMRKQRGPGGPGGPGRGPGGGPPPRG